MFGFGAPSPAPLDQRARDAAAAAQAELDLFEALVEHRRSRKRVYRNSSKTLSGMGQEEVGTNTLAYATGAFAGSETEVSRITIPAGVSKVRVTVHAYVGGTTTGYRHALGYWYHADGTLVSIDRAFGKSLATSTNTPTVSAGASSILSVLPGDYFVLFAQSSAAGGSIYGGANNEQTNYLEVEVVE